MADKIFRLATGTTRLCLEGGFGRLKALAEGRKTFMLTDAHVWEAHGKKLKRWDPIVIPPGEDQKVQSTADKVIRELIDRGADRDSLLVGVGGGVITDLAGYVASIYMRGIAFGFVPTSLLASVDAALGGKNGIDVGPYKNMVGLIRQPSFILQDPLLLQTLPQAHWRDGFAEIIKHACIRDAVLFRELEKNDLQTFLKNKKATAALIRRNALLKMRIVEKDEGEKGDRRLLNFGHTLGHAVETRYGLTHGEAVAVGMAFAARLSEQITGFRQADRVLALIQRYELPVELRYDKDAVIGLLKMDKKKQKDSIRFILLERIGKAVIQTLPVSEIYQQL